MHIAKREFEFIREGTVAQVSVLLPVFNQAEIVGSVIEGIFKSMSTSFELFIIDDHSSDGSLQEIVEAVRHFSPIFQNLARASVFRSRLPLFETACDNFLATFAQSPWLLEIQADMMVEDPGFDLRLISAAKRCNLFAVSGRGVHSFELVGLSPVATYDATLLVPKPHSQEPLSSQGEKDISRLDSVFERSRLDNEIKIFPNFLEFRDSHRAGRLDANVEHFDPEWRHYFDVTWIGDTVMRGPLLLKRDEFERLNGFDEMRFYLGGDDHDLNHRAAMRGLRVGFTPVEFTSRLEHGSTRKRKPFTSLLMQKIYQARAQFFRLT